MELAVRALHKAFDLDQVPAQLGSAASARDARAVRIAADGAVTEWPKVLPC